MNPASHTDAQLRVSLPARLFRRGDEADVVGAVVAHLCLARGQAPSAVAALRTAGARSARLDEVVLAGGATADGASLIARRDAHDAGCRSPTSAPTAGSFCRSSTRSIARSDRCLQRRMPSTNNGHRHHSSNSSNNNDDDDDQLSCLSSSARR